MPFFLNPFDQEFRGSLPFADRQYSLTFAIPANKNRSDYMESWLYEPYDLSSNGTLTINFAYDTNFVNYSALAINIQGGTPSATMASEIVALLNASTTFSDLFYAETRSGTPPTLPAGLQYSPVKNPSGRPAKVLIKGKSKLRKTGLRAWISDSSAEQMLLFNNYASVVELPTYYARHTIANRFTYPDSLGALIQLDTSNAIDQIYITNAGLDYSVVQADWQLFRGRVGLFNFQKITVDGSDRITQIIEYPAGALAGDIARLIGYVYTGSNTQPSAITEIPYTLTSGDLITP